MADNANGHAKLWHLVIAVVGLAAPGLIAWGSTQQEVRNHDIRITTLERTDRERASEGAKVLERLAAIEAQIKFLVDAEARRQQREGR